ncbi:MAG: putative manganese transporter [Candidatus Scatovivens sp.]
MLDILLDTIIDSLKILPFLFLTYLLMEYLEHKMSDKTRKIIKSAGKAGPLYGALLGAFPQCGFSVAASNLYCGRVITLGTLIAIYLSTSDEMLPILISEQVSFFTILKIIIIKVIIGIIIGFLIDIIFVRNSKNSKQTIEEKIGHICENEECDCEHNGILKSSIKHTINIIIFIFVITLIFNLAIEFIGEEKISSMVLNKPIVGPIIAGLVGLIPNCASSVIITQLYLKELISFGSVISGLLVSAGVGLLVLFKENKNLKENLKVTGILYLSGIASGILVELITKLFV